MIKETYTIEEMMEMHLYFANRIIESIDRTKRFVHKPETREVITERKGLIWGWKTLRTQSYEEVMLEDFNIN